MGRPQRAWYWNRQAITAAITCGIPPKATRVNERSAMAWAMAWRAERYMAMTLGLPSSTSSLHPGIAAYPDENEVTAILHFLAVICGKIIDRDQNHGSGGSNYATTVQLGEELEEARQRLFPPHWWHPDQLTPDMTQAEGWYRQSTKVIFFTALKIVHLPYMMRAGTDSRYAHSWDTCMGAARTIANAYREFRRWPKGTAELCQLMDFRAFSAALVLVIGHWVAPARSSAAAAEEDAALVRDVALCLRQTAAVLECRVAEQAVRALDVLDAARRGVYMSDDDYDVVIPYFGRIRINRDMVQPGQQQLLQKPEVAVSDYFNTIEFSTSDFLVDFPTDTGESTAVELCCDWSELGLGYCSADWGHTFTCGPFFETNQQHSWA